MSTTSHDPKMIEVYDVAFLSSLHLNVQSLKLEAKK